MSKSIQTTNLGRLKQKLKKEVEGDKLLVMGVGNPRRGGDAIGSRTADVLRKKVKNISVLNCKTNPENYIFEAKDLSPESIVFINAIKNGDVPGKLVFKGLPDEEINQFLTHKVTLNSVAEILAGVFSEEKKDPSLYLVGVEISDTFQMTQEVEKRTNELVKLFSQLDKFVKPLGMENDAY